MCQITLHRPISKIAMRTPQHRRATMFIFHLHTQVCIAILLIDVCGLSWCSALVRIAILLIDACGVGRHSASLLICVWGSNCLTQIGKIAMCQITLHRPISKIAMRAPQHRRARMSIFHLHFSILLMKSWNHALLFW